MNIEQRRWVRQWRRWIRLQLEELWYDTPEDRQLEQIYASPYDIFDLTRLFGLQPYEEDAVEEEDWAIL